MTENDWAKVLRVCNEIESAPLWIDESSDLGLLDLRAKARRLHASEISNGNGGLSLIVLDYIQLMRAEDMRANRVEQVGQMSRGLKILARELKVPVIALSQLSRAPEQRTGRDKRPILSDLRESGNLEQDADLVAFIYREDYYRNFGEDDVDPAEREELKGIAELIVRKNRNGPIDTVKLAFQEQFASFHTWPTSTATRACAPTRRWSPRPTIYEPETDTSEPNRPAVEGLFVSRVETLPTACPLAVCDGSGWIVDDEDVARPCECRERRIAQARTRGVRTVLPPKYQGVGFDRPPVSDMARDPQKRAVLTKVREFVDDLDENIAEGRGLWLHGRRRHRQDDARDARSRRRRSRPGTRSRSTRCRACSRGSAAPTTPTRASSPTSSSSTA